jgi:hypothetical protein
MCRGGILMCWPNEYGVEIFYAHSFFYDQENRGICGVMLESNVEVMVSLCDLQK